jgi:polar amino acid transport system substrate-binding protein
MKNLFELTRRDLLKTGAGIGLLMAGGGLIIPGSALAETTLEKARREKTLRVGFANESPYAFASPEGKLIGLMPDVIHYIMGELGIPNLEGVLTEFGGLIPGLMAGRFDILGAGLYVRPVRCEQVAPSDPQYVITEAIAVKKANPKNLHSYTDVAKNPDARIGTLAGSINAQYLADAGVPSNRVVLFPDLPSAIAGLQGGRVDGVTMSIISIQDILQKTNDPNLEMATPFTDPVDKNGKPISGYGASWFRKADTDLLSAYNTKLAAIKANGKLLELMAPYGFTKAQVPAPDVTAAQLCKA